MNLDASDSLYPATGVAARRSKVSIIGAGAVGTALAYACTIKGYAREIVLYDINREKAAAEALDIAHGIQFTPAASVIGTDDVEALRDSDVVVVTAGPTQKVGQSRLELVGEMAELMKKIMPKFVEVAPNAIFIMVTNPVDIATYISLKITGLPTNQLFGSGTVLDTSRLRYLVGQKTGVAVRNIHAYVVGEHGDSEVPLWSCAEVGNVPLTRWGGCADGSVFDAAVRASIAHDVMRSAYTIIEGKGNTSLAIGLSVTNIIGAVLRDEHRILTISTLLENWQGISGVCMAAPTLVGATGAGRVFEPPITLDEREALEKSAMVLSQVAKSIGF